MDFVPDDAVDAFLADLIGHVHCIEGDLSLQFVEDVVDPGFRILREKGRTSQGQECVPITITGLFPQPDVERIHKTPGVVVLYIAGRISSGSARFAMHEMKARFPVEKDFVIMLLDDLFGQGRKGLQVFGRTYVSGLDPERVKETVVVDGILIGILYQGLQFLRLPTLDLLRGPLAHLSYLSVPGTDVGLVFQVRQGEHTVQEDSFFQLAHSGLSA